MRPQLSPDVVDSYLKFQAAKRVHESCLCRLEASYIVGNDEHVRLSISALHDASEGIADRLRELVFAQLYQDGIDPFTRRSM